MKKGKIASVLVAAGLVAAGACSRREEKPVPAAGAVAATSGAETSTPATPAPQPATPPPRPPRPPREPEKVPDLTVPLRPMDKQILALVKAGADAKKVARAFAKTPKVELKARPAEKVTEVEVDLDGDGRADEKWRVEQAGGAVRKAIIREDLREDVFNLEGDGWKLVAGSGRSATQVFRPPAPLRPVDKDILARAAKPGKDSDDATPGKPYRVALSKEQGSDKLNRAKLDLDRDGKWDEMWSIDLPTVRRNVAPKDDGNYTDRYRLVDGKWFAQ